MKCSLCISSFLGEISNLSYSIVFLYFFVLISQKDFLISPCYSLELCMQMGISFLFSFAFSFSSFLSCVRPPQTTILPFAFLFLGDIFLFYFIFKLYIIVLVLPNIKMNPPQVHMCSPSRTLLPPPSPFHPSGSSQCTSPKHPVSCIEPGLATRFIHGIIHVSMYFFLHPALTDAHDIYYLAFQTALASFVNFVRYK